MGDKAKKNIKNAIKARNAMLAEMDSVATEQNIPKKKKKRSARSKAEGGFLKDYK